LVVISFTAETFRPRIAEQFRVALEGGHTLELQLEEVTTGGCPAPPGSTVAQ
jgi:hypothetical protein